MFHLLIFLLDADADAVGVVVVVVVSLPSGGPAAGTWAMIKVLQPPLSAAFWPSETVSFFSLEIR